MAKPELVQSLLLLLSTILFLHVLLHPVPPSYNWPSSLMTLSFTHIYFLHKLLILLSTWPNYHISFYPFHYTTLHSICTRFHHAFIALTFPSYHAAYSSQITNFYNMYSWLLFPIPNQSLWSICQCWQNTVLETSLYFHVYISSSHYPCK